MTVLRSILGVLVIVGAATSADAPHRFTSNQKEYYLDAATSVFIRPGFNVSVVSTQISTGGKITVNFKISDAGGLPLDRDGAFTPGLVTTTFILAYIPKGQSQYTSYTTRIRTDAATGKTATQATGDTGGIYAKVADGEYTYTFAFVAPASLDRSATHTVGVWATRNLSAFDLSNAFADTAYTFVPAGSAVLTVRDIVKTASCNQCHNPISAHGGARRSVEVCILCHTPQTSDPVTGTVDFPVMVHKIHMGSSLPSVKAGGTYKVGTSDFSDVVFPADVRNCTACHQQTTKAVQAEHYITNPNRAACGSCHDDVNFATGVNHPLPVFNDNQCSTCHIARGDLEFDASILGAHTVPNQSMTLAGVVFDLVKVDNGAAGLKPTVTFTIKDKAGNPIAPSTMTRLALLLAGPTADYSSYVSESALGATGSNGTYQFTFNAAVPADASGSWTVAVEGYKAITLLPGTTKQMAARDIGINKQISFSVDSSKTLERRAVVSIDKCNVCHFALAPHGGNRNQATQCTICHNPTNTDAATPAQGIDFATLVHKIHRGSALANGFMVGATDFSNVGFPGDLRDCSRCHINKSEQLPLVGDRLPVKDPKAYIPLMGASTAACLSCHDTKSSASHALANTSTLGESCDTCHGMAGEFSVSRVHAR